MISKHPGKQVGKCSGREKILADITGLPQSKQHICQLLGQFVHSIRFAQTVVGAKTNGFFFLFNVIGIENYGRVVHRSQIAYSPDALHAIGDGHVQINKYGVWPDMLKYPDRMINTLGPGAFVGDTSNVHRFGKYQDFVFIVVDE
jgi:hypothetical protein